MTTRTLLLAALSAAALLAPPGSALASPTAHAGYVAADESTVPSYTPSAAYQYNSLGGTNTILRSRTGHYEVFFPGLGAAGGAIDLTPREAEGVDCAVTGLANESGTEALAVDCADASGVPVDEQFLLAWTTAVSGNGGTLGYGSNLGPAYAYDSAGGRVRVRRKRTGLYTVAFPHVTNGGTVKATAVGTDATGRIGFCQVLKWAANRRSTALVVTVACYTANGTPSDMGFSATFANGVDLLGINAMDDAYLWAGQPSAPSYTPDPSRQFNNLAGPVNTVGRSGTGDYIVQLPSQGTPGVQTGDVQVTAYGPTPAHCEAGFWPTPTSSTQLAKVSCFDSAGAPLDAPFTLQWMRPL